MIKVQKNSYECDCGLIIPKIMSGRKIEPETAYELVQNKKTQLLSGFVSKKSNKTFSACLKLAGKKVIYEFPNEDMLDQLDIKICSIDSTTIKIEIGGIYRAEYTVSYGHISARHAQAYALTTVLFNPLVIKILNKVCVNIIVSNPTVALYVLKNRKPRDKELLEIMSIIWSRLSICKGWQIIYAKQESSAKIAGSPQSDSFPKDIFVGIDVGVEKRPGFSIVTLPMHRPDVHSQFEASISTAKKIPNEIGKYYVQRFAEKRLYAWIASVKGGIK